MKKCAFLGKTLPLCIKNGAPVEKVYGPYGVNTVK